MRRLTTALLAVLSAAGSAGAYEAAPTTPQIREAALGGEALAAPHEGYVLKDYLLFAVADALAIDPGSGSLDAVLLATPLERTRHAAFLGRYTGEPLSPGEARAAADLPDGWIEIILFAHGADAQDTGFVNRFGPMALVMNGRTLKPLTVVASTPFRDRYPKAENNPVRTIATVTCRFDLRAIPKVRGARGRLSFIDATGKRFGLPVDFARFP